MLQFTVFGVVACKFVFQVTDRRIASISGLSKAKAKTRMVPSRFKKQAQGNSQAYFRQTCCFFFSMQSLPAISQDQWQLGVLTPILVCPVVMSIPLVSALPLALLAPNDSTVGRIVHCASWQILASAG